jgi:[CysO sulfur-carrier protein]-S-L-cysteine hydrolase
VNDYAPLFPRLAALAEAQPDEEVCGFVTADSTGRLAVVPMRNVAGEGGDPAKAVRARREAYLVEPAAHLVLARELRAEGGRIAAVFHSHVDGPAHLSPADREGALEGETPVLPGVDQIVIGTRSGKVMEVRVFAWRHVEFFLVQVLPDLVPRRVARGAP